MKRVVWLQGRQDFCYYGRSNPLSKYQIGFWWAVRFHRNVSCVASMMQRGVGCWRVFGACTGRHWLPRKAVFS